ncbi:ABC transporter ATP-binding protein [Longispora fulva]
MTCHQATSVAPRHPYTRGLLDSVPRVDRWPATSRYRTPTKKE